MQIHVLSYSQLKTLFPLKQFQLRNCLETKISCSVKTKLRKQSPAANSSKRTESNLQIYFQRIRKKKLKTYHVNSKLFRLSLLHSIPTKKNLNFLPKESKKRKKLISHETHFNSPNPPQLQNMPFPFLNRCSKFHFHPNYPRHKVIPRVSPIFFFFFFYQRFLCDPSPGRRGERGGFKLSARPRGMIYRRNKSH